MQTERVLINKTIERARNQVPVQMTAFFSWRDIFRFLREHGRNVVFHIIPQADQQLNFTPEEETLLLKNAGCYTDQFIKKNERAKKDVKNIIICDSVDELQKSLNDEI